MRGPTAITMAELFWNMLLLYPRNIVLIKHFSEYCFVGEKESQ